MSRGQGPVGSAMNDLGSAPFFSSLNDVIDEAAAFLKSDSLMLITTADLHSILALGFLESALLDHGISYSRRIMPPNSHIPPDEQDFIAHQDDKNILFIDAWNRFESSSENQLFDHVHLLLVWRICPQKFWWHHHIVDRLSAVGPIEFLY